MTEGRRRAGVVRVFNVVGRVRQAKAVAYEERYGGC